MKKLFTILIGVLIASTPLQAQGVKFFEGTLDEACAKAKAENKKVFIDFSTEWCGPCKAVDQHVFPTEEAGRFFNEHFINLKVDAEKGDGPALTKEYNIEGYPTFIILQPDKQECTRWVGASMRPTPESFIKIVTEKAGEHLAANEGINTREISLEEAKKLARAEKKYILLDCYTEWCGPCKMMDKNVFPLKEVGDYVNPRFVFMKCDMEKGEGPMLRQKFGVRAYPTYIVMDAEENVIHSFEGYNSVDAFIITLKGALDKSISPEAIIARFQAGERSKAFLVDYIAALSAKRDYPAAMEAVNILAESLTEEEKVSPDYWFIYDRYAYSDAKYEKYLIDHRERFNQTVGEKRVNKLLANICVSGYSSLFPAMAREEPDPQQLRTRLSDMDRKAKSLKVDAIPMVALCRAAANMRINHEIEAFLEAFEKYQQQIPTDDIESLATQIAISPSLQNTFSASQKERLKALVTTDKTKGIVENMLRVTQ